MKSGQQPPYALSDQQSGPAKFCLDHSALSFFQNDKSGRILYANQKACRSLGYTLDELLARSIFDISPLVTAEDWSDFFQRLNVYGAETLEATHLRKDGTTFPVEVTASMLKYKGRRFAIAFVQDISNRKNVEKALRLTQFSFDKASIGIFRSGVNARILNVNEQGCKSLGYTREELCNMSIYDIDAFLSKEQRSAQWEILCREGIITFETIHRRKDGSTFPVEITANLLKFGSINYSMSFVRDITVQKNDEKQKAAMEAHLQQAYRMEALGTLAGGIAHDFNNILSAIIGYTELAQLSCDGNPQAQKYIRQLRIAGSRAKDLVQQIMTFSRQSKSEKIPLDISRVLDETLKLIRVMVPATIEIRSRIQTNLGAVFADETQIHQIVMNLCTNAYQAMEKEGGVLEVDLAPVTISRHDLLSHPDMKPGRYLKLVFADTGHGMQKDVLARIFDPYFTTKKITGGTGMGLSTVHGIVKDHGGSINVYSESGVGTTFQIFFPFAETSPDPSTKTKNSLPRGNEHILFVDDEDMMIEIGKDLLEGLGYVVETRVSPVDAIEAFRAHPAKYDLVFSDITMPKITGDQLAEKIKKIRPDIPIILASGFSSNLDSTTLKKIGIDDVLMKPVTMNELARTVRRVLDKKKKPAAGPTS